GLVKLLEKDRDDQAAEIRGGHRDDRDREVVEGDGHLRSGTDEGSERLMPDRCGESIAKLGLRIQEGRQRGRGLENPCVIRENGRDRPVPAPKISLHPGKDTWPSDPFVGTCVPLPSRYGGLILTAYTD